MSGFIHRIDETKLKFMRQRLGDLSLQECIELAQQAEGYLEFMPVTDPAWKHFTEERLNYWKFAWLLSCEADRLCPSDPHVVYRRFVVAFPKRQTQLDPCEYSRWLYLQPGDIVTEFSAYFPVYLRDNEINRYAIDIFHKQTGIEGRLQNVEIEELEQEE